MRNFASTLVKFSKLSHIQTTIWRPPKMAPPALRGQRGPLLRHCVIQCHEALDELAKRNTVYIKWIAAHVGHRGNERADELAKIGTTSTSLVSLIS